MAITTTEFVNELVDEFVAQGVPIASAAALKAALLTTTNNWLGSPDALLVNTVQRITQDYADFLADVQSRFNFWFGTATGGYNSDGTPSDGISPHGGYYPFTLTDGTTVYNVSLAKLVLSTAKGDPGGITFTFSTTTTDADPGNGNLRLNNATMSSATMIYADNLGAAGSDVTAWLDSFDDTGATARGLLYIQQAGSTKFAIFKVTGAVVNGTGYRKIPVAYVSGSTLFDNTQRLAITFAGMVDDAALVHIAGTETITGAKTFSASATFSSRPVVSAADMQAPLFVGMGGFTSSFPALKRNGATLEARKGDDSGYTDFQAANLYGATFSGAIIPTNIYGSSASSAFTIGSDPIAGITAGSYVQFWGSTSANPGLLVLGSGAASLQFTAANGLNLQGQNLKWGITSSFPMLKRSSSQIQARLGDDSAYASFRALGYVMSLGSVIQDSGDGYISLTNNAGSSFTRLNFGPVTSSFAAFRRNGTALEAVLGDESAYTTFAAQNLAAQGAGTIYWAGRTVMAAPSDGVLTLENNAGTDFGRLQFGGTTSSFPAWKRSSTVLHARLADDSAYTSVVAHTFQTDGGAGTGLYFSGTGSFQVMSDGVFALFNNAATGFSRLQFGGTTSSFPAWKRNGAVFEARLADDSAFADLNAGSITSAGKKVLTSPWDIVALGDESSLLTTGDKVTFRCPAALTLTDVKASVTTATGSGLPTFNIKKNGTTIFSTKLTIDATEKTSRTAATAYVFTAGATVSFAEDDEIVIAIDTAGTGGAGAKVTLYWNVT